MEKKVIGILEKALKKENIKFKEVSKIIEVPKDYSKGDFAFPCFVLTKEIKKNPHEIALQIRKSIGKTPEDFVSIETHGPYINFYINRKKLIFKLLRKIDREKENFGRGNLGKNKKILIEFSSPNIAKPFGVGHLRSTIIGNSIANIAQFQNFKVKRMNYLGDWGTQFGKLMAGFEEFGNEKKLKENPIQHLYEIYVKVNKEKKYEEISRQWFNKLEKGDKKALNLWKKFRESSLKEFDEIYSRLNIKFDVVLSESMYNSKMKDVVKELEKKKIAKKDDGAKIIDLKKEKLGIALIEKSDGSTLYTTRDLASAIERYKKYKFDFMVYEVGQEQKLHFRQFFKILQKMNYKWAKNCLHIDHGLYLGEDGKKLSTRKGKTIFMEEILDETEKLTKKQIKKRSPKISKEELNKRSKIIAKAAIFYGDLKNNRSNDMIFNLEKFVSFEGNTGPYLLYSYARASSILRKIKEIPTIKMPNEFEDSELKLSLALNEFGSVVNQAYRQMNPAIIANYSYKLAQKFNEFYHSCPVIDGGKEKFRLHLTSSFRQVLKNSLNLLGIDVLEEM